MTRIPAALALLLALAGCISAGGAQAGEFSSEVPPFRRGIAIHSLLNWGALVPGRTDRYAARPFAGPDYELPEALLAHVAAAGFDFVRLTVDPGPFLQLTGPARDALDTRLAGTVSRLLAHRLAVVVDLHGNTQVPAYDPQAVVASGDGPLFKSYLALVRRTARLLAGLKRKDVGLELMNEPPYGYDDETRRRWQRQIEALYTAARSEAPEMTLVLTGSHGGDRDGLSDLDPRPFRDSRVLYSFHYYEPHDFTHQGVDGGGVEGRYRAYLSGLPYPSDRLPRARAEAVVRANIEADPALSPAARLAIRRQVGKALDAYFAVPRDRAGIARDFDTVSAWAKRYAIPADRIFLGEFGATRSYDDHRAGDPTSYANWLRDVRREAEARRFGWAIWALTGTGGMALNDTDGGSGLDANSLTALGLKPTN